MNAALLLNDIALYCLQIGLVVGLAAFVPALLRLRLPGAKLAYWQFLLAACLVLPAVRPWKRSVIDVTPPVAAAQTAAAVPALPAVPAPRPARLTQTEVLLALLAAGVVVRLGWLSVGLWRLRRYRLNSSAADNRFLPYASGLKRVPDLRLSADIASPVTFGFLRPVILLPIAFPNLDPRIRGAILAHEREHVRRRDWLFTLIEEIIRAAFWFHPAIWWLLGEIQLAREQVVDRASVEMTRSREEYVDALLAIAGVRPELDLAPAPLFLRKRHLKHRVVSILKEVRMSKRHSVSALAAGLCILAAACWLATGAFPLAAAPQVVADAPGVSVDLGGSALMHRTRVEYPPAARAAHIEGLVTVEATVDSAGNVTDARVVGGPDELRKAALQSVLQWHFARGGGSTRSVSLMFRLPAEDIQPAHKAAGPPVILQQAEPSAAAASDAFNAIMAEQKALVAQLPARQDQQAMSDFNRKLQYFRTRSLALTRIRAITTPGLSDQARADLLASLPVHVGDAPTDENMARLREAVRKFDAHLFVASRGTAAADEVEIQVGVGTEQSASLADTGSPRITVGGMVQQERLTRKVTPVYPPLAREARIQGHVVMNAVIGKDGTVQALSLVSGHPLLAQAALEAVKQWTYTPLSMNGAPVEVSTQVDVNFALGDAPPQQ